MRRPEDPRNTCPSCGEPVRGVMVRSISLSGPGAEPPARPPAQLTTCPWCGSRLERRPGEAWRSLEPDDQPGG